MTDRPILFSAPMIRALLDGSKTQTRRLLKPQPSAECASFHQVFCDAPFFEARDASGEPISAFAVKGGLRSPHPSIRINIGDRLWVKENFKVDGAVPCQQLETESGLEWDDGAALIVYDADRSSVMIHDLAIDDRGIDQSEQAVRYSQKAGLIPSIFMPRWASRITLTVTDVRVQRLQDISCADAIAEGITPSANSMTIDCDTPDPREDFASLWDGISKDRCPWSSNPWVVAYSFKIYLGNIDQMEATPCAG